MSGETERYYSSGGTEVTSGSTSEGDLYIFYIGSDFKVTGYGEWDNGSFKSEDFGGKTFEVIEDGSTIVVGEIEDDGRTHGEVFIKLSEIPAGITLPAGAVLYKKQSSYDRYEINGDDNEDLLVGQRRRADWIQGFGDDDTLNGGGAGSKGRKGSSGVYDTLIGDGDSVGNHGADTFVLATGKRSFYLDPGFDKGKGKKKGRQDTFVLIEDFNSAEGDRLSAGAGKASDYKISSMSGYGGFEGLVVVSDRNPKDVIAVLQGAQASGITELSQWFLG